MTNDPNLLTSLIELSKIDTSLALIRAEKKKFETDLVALVADIKKSDLEKQKRAKLVDEKKALYAKEEKRLREERDKLAGRRTALTTLSNYKLQQSAEKEIENAGRLLNEQEEALISSMVEMDDISVPLKKIEDHLVAQKEKYKNLEVEARETTITLNEREQRKLVERNEVAGKIEPKTLINYDRIREKHTMNPVVAINASSCSACYMQIGPQIMQQIGRGDSLARCPGCGRILFVPKES